MARKADEPYRDPFPNLPRQSAVERRFKTIEEPKPAPSPKVAKARQVLAKAEQAAKPLAKAKPPSASKRGRPVAPKPWEDEGISRSTWLRRKKASGE